MPTRGVRSVVAEAVMDSPEGFLSAAARLAAPRARNSLRPIIAAYGNSMCQAAPAPAVLPQASSGTPAGPPASNLVVLLLYFDFLAVVLHFRFDLVLAARHLLFFFHL